MSKYFRLILLSISFSSFNCLLDPYGLRSTEKKERILRPINSVSYGFRITIGGYVNECYYQEVDLDEVLRVSMIVMDGGNHNVDFLIYDPAGKDFHAELDIPFTWYDSPEIENFGVYQVCVRNNEGTEKAVYLNIVADSGPEYEKIKIIKQKVNESQTFMEERTNGITRNLFQVTRLQIRQRMSYSVDSLLAEKTNEYVNYYSIAQSCVVILSGIFQTFFIKRLFESRQANAKAPKL